jgi:2-(1,2-epoxy-1,2-dihydrophenyl)acetyl-CoA isomerase
MLENNIYKTILLKREKGIITVTLNRPEKRNALNFKSFQELEEVINEVAADSTAKVIIITGRGKSFCAGGDVRDVENRLISTRDINKIRAEFIKVHRTVLAMRRLEKPIIAAVNGEAVGAGCDLALACDMRIAADTASFGEVYIKVGGLPDMGGTYFLPRIVGLSKAFELIFTGKIIDAHEAEQIGLINKVVPLEKLEEVAMELAVKLATGPSIAIGLAKSLIYGGLNLDLQTALDQVASGIAMCLLTKDSEEGIAAFNEKRIAVFEGE